MAFSFTSAGKLFMGTGALTAAAPDICKLGKKALIISGSHVSKSSGAEQLYSILKEHSVSYSLFTGITGEPDTTMIAAGIAELQKSGCDFVIGFGGGSPLDSAKAIAAFSVLGAETISSSMGKEIAPLDKPFPPLVLIPTTAGTGSETTKFTVITDAKAGVKMLLKGNALLPQIAVVDPEFTVSAPPAITAATGMDALTHAVESYTSRKANALTDMYALSAVERLLTWLPAAYKDGTNKKAREECAIAAFQAGVCINNASVTLVHGMSRPIGALFHVPHGISNAMLITECLAFAADGCTKRFADLGRIAAKVQQTAVPELLSRQLPVDASDHEAAEAFISTLSNICGILDIPTLEKYGINKNDFMEASGKMADDALASGSPANTIKPINKKDVLSIYEKLWR